MKPEKWIPMTKEKPAVEMRSQAASNTRNAGSSLANCAFVSYRVEG